MSFDVIQQALFNRYFEYGAAQGLKDGYVRNPIYLSVGTEFIPPLLKQSLIDCNIKEYAIFAQHRCHSYYLTFADKPKELALELCGSKRGCNKGWGGSASISHTEGSIKMFGHSGLLGDQVPIAVGYAHATQKPTICILGDAAAEEDYVLGALGYAITKKAPILFICEDNNLSLLTTKAERRSWDIVEVVRAMGIEAINIPLRYKFGSIRNYILDGLHNIKFNKPSFININVYRHLWHAGAGQDCDVKYDWYQNEIKDSIPSILETRNLQEHEAKKLANAIWEEVKNDHS